VPDGFAFLQLKGRQFMGMTGNLWADSTLSMLSRNKREVSDRKSKARNGVESGWPLRFNGLGSTRDQESDHVERTRVAG
jgi:hypothetical protein